MKKYAEKENYILYHSDMNKMEEDIEPNSISSIITDPPYGLTSIVKRFGKEGSAPAQFGKDGAFSRLSKGFMGKEWDGSGVEYSVEAWRHCFNVLKPGGYLLAFGGSRTFHRIACAIEDAGFEIRDTIMWIYGSGFPKSMDIGKKVFVTNRWDGWGTCLKPAYEPIIVARKPFKGSLIKNVIENGVGGLNIDECRVEIKNEVKKGGFGNAKTGFQKGIGNSGDKDYKCEWKEDTNGRFPANVILTYDETDFEEVCGGFPNRNKPNGSLTKKYECNNEIYGDMPPRNEFESYQDAGSAARYFYCAKASKKDRDDGLETFETQTKVFNGKSSSSSEEMKDVEKRFTTEGKNIHPTVKPTELMQYLVRLVTPKGGTILDCFMGSGSTGKAVMLENRERNANYKFIGIEMTDEYLPICEARIDYALNKYNYEERKQNVIEEHNLFTAME